MLLSVQGETSLIANWPLSELRGSNTSRLALPEPGDGSGSPPNEDNARDLSTEPNDDMSTEPNDDMNVDEDGQRMDVDEDKAPKKKRLRKRNVRFGKYLVSDMGPNLQISLVESVESKAPKRTRPPAKRGKRGVSLNFYFS
jgi:hypothetical protein